VDQNTPTRRTVLKTAAGTAAATFGLASFAGSAAAHFPAELSIDVVPGAERSPVNPDSDGLVSVAVHRTETFDPVSEHVRYGFGSHDAFESGDGARVVTHHTADVDGDGSEELVLQFRTSETGLDHDDTEAELKWYRDESLEHGLSGHDEITTVGGGRR
jgi:hypothetical protein